MAKLKSCTGVIMPKGPQGQKRPADVIGNAITIARMATGEIEDNMVKSGKIRSGHAGAKVRNEKLSKEKRTEIAKKAAKVRWNKNEY